MGIGVCGQKIDVLCGIITVDVPEYAYIYRAYLLQRYFKGLEI